MAASMTRVVFLLVLWIAVAISQETTTTLSANEEPVTKCDIHDRTKCTGQELFYLSKYAGQPVGVYRTELARLVRLLKEEDNSDIYEKWIRCRIQLLRQLTADDKDTTRKEADRSIQ